MRSQLEKNKEILMDEIERLSCEKMTEATAARLSAYRGAYKALCLLETEDYGETADRARTDDKPAHTPELDGDTEFERVIMSIPTDRAHMVAVAKIFNNHMESLSAVNIGAYSYIPSERGGDVVKSYGNTQLLDLLQEAVDIGARGEAWHHKMMLWAQSHGLQGHKRLNRYESGKDRAHYIKLQNYAIDMFDEVLKPSENFVISSPTDVKGYLEAYVSWENSVYTRLAAINGQLIGLGFPSEAKLVRGGLPRKELKRVRRMLTEYSLSGWDIAYILQDDKELHDKIKKREKYRLLSRY